jgi:hypothetical protein
MAAKKSSNKGDDAAKVRRRRDVKEKSRQANSALEAARNENERMKKQLEDLAKSKGDDENSEHDEEYKRLKEELERSGSMLKEVESEAQKAKEEEDSEMKDADPEEEDGSLFVPKKTDGDPSDQQSGLPLGSTDPLPINLTNPNGNHEVPKVDDDPEDAGLFTPDHAREAAGRSDDGVVVAWRQQGYSRPIIIGYGPLNARKYEPSTAYRSGIPFDEANTAKFGPDDRLGDQKIGKKFVRTYGEFKGISGECYDCKIDELKPKEKGEKRTYPRTELRVKWEINGEIKRTWETRSSIKHLWPNPTRCDEYIYGAAIHHAKQHQDWLQGQRVGKEKSPSPSPNMNRLMPQNSQGEKVIKKEGDGGSGSSSSSKSPMIQYREQWCELEEIDPQNMTSEDKANFLLSWNMIKLKI